MCYYKSVLRLFPKIHKYISQIICHQYYYRISFPICPHNITCIAICQPLTQIVSKPGPHLTGSGCGNALLIGTCVEVSQNHPYTPFTRITYCYPHGYS